VNIKEVASYLELTKPKVTALLTLGGVAGGFLAYSHSALFRILIGAIAVVIASSGINCITNYIDRDIDAVMERTRNRPLPTGRIKPPINAVYFGIILVTLSIIILLPFSIYAVFWIIFGVLFDPIFYNYYTKRKTAWNIVIGSFAGGAPVFVVWATVTDQLFSIYPFLLFLLIVLWTPIHIWSLSIKYVNDYKKANIPMLPVTKSINFTIKTIGIFSIFLFLISLAIYFELALNLVIFLILVLINLILLIYSFSLLINPTEKTAYVLFKITSPYLAIVFIIVIIHALV
jgi:protoheme IX farnesyltransferase